MLSSSDVSRDRIGPSRLGKLPTLLPSCSLGSRVEKLLRDIASLRGGTSTDLGLFNIERPALRSINTDLADAGV